MSEYPPTSLLDIDLIPFDWIDEYEGLDDGQIQEEISRLKVDPENENVEEEVQKLVNDHDLLTLQKHLAFLTWLEPQLCFEEEDEEKGIDDFELEEQRRREEEEEEERKRKDEEEEEALWRKKLEHLNQMEQHLSQNPLSRAKSAHSYFVHELPEEEKLDPDDEDDGDRKRKEQEEDEEREWKRKRVLELEKVEKRLAASIAEKQEAHQETMEARNREKFRKQKEALMQRTLQKAPSITGERSGTFKHVNSMSNMSDGDYEKEVVALLEQDQARINRGQLAPSDAFASTLSFFSDSSVEQLEQKLNFLLKFIDDPRVLGLLARNNKTITSKIPYFFDRYSGLQDKMEQQMKQDENWAASRRRERETEMKRAIYGKAAASSDDVMTLVSNYNRKTGQL